MAGHSKWANIKHRKAAQDAARGKVFTRLIREIVIAARTGGATLEDNPRLRAAVDKALGANMKKDTVENAIARGAGTGDSDNVEEVTYEGYGPGGVAFLVEVMTDNRNRTVAEIRHAFSRRGGNLGTGGSVAFLFVRCGQLSYPAGSDEEQIMEAALAAGANDVVTHDDGSVDVLTPWEDFIVVKEVMVAVGLAPESGEVTMLPTTTVTLGLSGAESTLGLLEALEDLDDVQNVYSNADIPGDIIATLS